MNCPATPPPPERWRPVMFRGRKRRPKARLTKQLVGAERVDAAYVYDPPAPTIVNRQKERNMHYPPIPYEPDEDIAEALFARREPPTQLPDRYRPPDLTPEDIEQIAQAGLKRGNQP